MTKSHTSRESINNYTTYNAQMRLGIRDKLFFEGLVDDKIDTFVDFGCASGDILEIIHEDNPTWRLYGIDNDKTMRELCKKKCPTVTLASDITEISLNTQNAILNLSSVVHEIYSYLSDEDVKYLWDKIFGMGFRYIAIRDLMPQATIVRNASIGDIKKVYQRGDRKQIDDFVREFGSLVRNENLVHFLLKYRYIENWEREVRENYFPITTEEFLKIIPDEYEIVYLHNYILPYTKDIIKKDFDITLQDSTHIKILLKRKETH